MFGRTDASSRADLTREALAYADALHEFAYHLTATATETEAPVQETRAKALGVVARWRPRLRPRSDLNGSDLRTPAQRIADQH